jgi:hypothetical protein
MVNIGSITANVHIYFQVLILKLSKCLLMVNLSKYERGTLLAKAYSQNFPCLIVTDRFRIPTSSYYRGTSAFLLFYDISFRDSFDSLTDWIELIG